MEDESHAGGDYYRETIDTSPMDGLVLHSSLFTSLVGLLMSTDNDEGRVPHNSVSKTRELRHSDVSAARPWISQPKTQNDDVL